MNTQGTLKKAVSVKELLKPLTSTARTTQDKEEDAEYLREKFKL